MSDLNVNIRTGRNRTANKLGQAIGVAVATAAALLVLSGAAWCLVALWRSILGGC